MREPLPYVEPGASPGSFPNTPHAAASSSMFAFGPDGVSELKNPTREQLDAAIAGDGLVWLDVEGHRDQRLLTELAEAFSLHSLAIEDVARSGQRPKLEIYDTHLFLVARMAHLGPRPYTEQVSAFAGPGFVVTVQEGLDGDVFGAVRRRIRESSDRITTSGPDYLLYSILDAVVDSYYPVVEHYADRLEILEAIVLERTTRAVLNQIYACKRELIALRRAVWPHRDAVTAFLRDEAGFVNAETRPYLLDCQDHVVQLVELIDSQRELATDLVSVHMSAIGNRMNEVMKVLTMIATIFIPLSFVAGVYGMNFDRDASRWNMPELGWAYGYPFSLALMAAVAGVLLYAFWRRGWFKAE